MATNCKKPSKTADLKLANCKLLQNGNRKIGLPNRSNKSRQLYHYFQRQSCRGYLPPLHLARRLHLQLLLQRHGPGYLRQNLLLENPAPKTTKKHLKIGIKNGLKVLKSPINKGPNACAFYRKNDHDDLQLLLYDDLQLLLPTATLPLLPTPTLLGPSPSTLRRPSTSRQLFTAHTTSLCKGRPL
jgi:hypothetical protein